MDFRALPRRDLQALCKRSGVRANMSNAAMADALAALPSVDGVDAPAPALGVRRRAAPAAGDVVRPTRQPLKKAAAAAAAEVKSTPRRRSPRIAAARSCETGEGEPQENEVDVDQCAAPVSSQEDGSPIPATVVGQDVEQDGGARSGDGVEMALVVLADDDCDSEVECLDEMRNSAENANEFGTSEEKEYVAVLLHFHAKVQQVIEEEVKEVKVPGEIILKLAALDMDGEETTFDNGIYCPNKQGAVKLPEVTCTDSKVVEEKAAVIDEMPQIAVPSDDLVHESDMADEEASVLDSCGHIKQAIEEEVTAVKVLGEITLHLAALDIHGGEITFCTDRCCPDERNEAVSVVNEDMPQSASTSDKDVEEDNCQDEADKHNEVATGTEDECTGKVSCDLSPDTAGDCSDHQTSPLYASVLADVTESQNISINKVPDNDVVEKKLVFADETPQREVTTDCDSKRDSFKIESAQPDDSVSQATGTRDEDASKVSCNSSGHMNSSLCSRMHADVTKSLSKRTIRLESMLSGDEDICLCMHKKSCEKNIIEPAVKDVKDVSMNSSNLFENSLGKLRTMLKEKLVSDVKDVSKNSTNLFENSPGQLRTMLKSLVSDTKVVSKNSTNLFDTSLGQLRTMLKVQLASERKEAKKRTALSRVDEDVCRPDAQENKKVKRVDSSRTKSTMLTWRRWGRMCVDPMQMASSRTKSATVLTWRR